MKEFTGWEYLLIDVANNFGLDKLRFEERITWANHNLSNLEELAERYAELLELPIVETTGGER